MTFDYPREALSYVRVAEVVAKLVIFQQVMDRVSEDTEGFMLQLHFVGGALIADFVQRFAAACEGSHEKGYGACWRDGDEGAVSQSVFLDECVDIRGFFLQKLHKR